MKALEIVAIAILCILGVTNILLWAQISLLFDRVLRREHEEEKKAVAENDDYKELATELTRTLCAIDDVCVYCAERNGKEYCDHYIKSNGNVPFETCRDGLKKFLEQHKG